jgi:hypothetical protein
VRSDGLRSKDRSKYGGMWSSNIEFVFRVRGLTISAAQEVDGQIDLDSHSHSHR